MSKIKKDYPSLKKDLTWHFIVSFFVSSIIYFSFKSVGLSLLAFLSGFAIDIDHLFDYFLIYGFRFNPQKFFNSYQFVESRKVYVFLHAWEWLVLMLLVGLLTGALRPIMAIALGVGGHLVVDQILSFKNEPFFYFLTYRIIKNFDLEVLDRNFKKKWNISQPS